MPPEVTKAERDCAECGRFMVSQRRWRAYPVAERRVMIADGFFCHGADDLCKSCLKKARTRAAKATA